MASVHDYTLEQWRSLTPEEREATKEAMIWHLRGGLDPDEQVLEQLGRSPLSDQYMEFTRAEISVGCRVRADVIKQFPSFKEEAKSRARFERERLEACGPGTRNRDVNVLRGYGLALRRKDQEPVAPALGRQVLGALDIIAGALDPQGHGLCAAAWRRADVTIVYNGNRPIYRSPRMGATFDAELMTIVLTTNHAGIPMRYLGHEVAHLLDCDRKQRPGFADLSIYKSETAVAAPDRDPSARQDSDLYLQAVASMTCGTCRDGCDSYPNGFVCPAASGGCACLPSEAMWKDTVACRSVQANTAVYRRPREVWARLVEEYIAWHTPGAGVATSPASCYYALPAYWDEAAFKRLVPMIEAGVKRRIERWGKQGNK